MMSWELFVGLIDEQTSRGKATRSLPEEQQR